MPKKGMQMQEKSKQGWRMYPFDAGEHSQHKRRTVSIKGRRDKPK